MLWCSVGAMAEFYALVAGVVVCSVIYFCTFRGQGGRTSKFNSYCGSRSCSLQEL